MADSLEDCIGKSNVGNGLKRRRAAFGNYPTKTAGQVSGAGLIIGNDR
jgi:hypothetical protein